ncbi:MAG: hypothetical protein HOP11_14315 [Saprospiraceae bacterium]|nr:hypothetical protein [Saprospiraceae bacterium]
MIKATLLKTTGEKIAIDLPENGTELKLSQALDFELKCFDLFEWLKVNVDNFSQKKGEYLIRLVDCLNVVYGDIVDFFDLKGDYINDIDNEKINQHFETLKGDYNKDEAFDSLMGIFNILYMVIRTTKPELRELDHFVYKGKEFVFPKILKDRLFNDPMFPSPSVKQSIETLNVMSWLEDIKNSKDEKITEQVKTDNIYHKYLTELSVLLIEKGKKLPTEEAEFNMFIREQRVFFEDIDFQTALDVEFWFENYYDSLRKDRENYYYFNSNEKNTPKNGDELTALNRAKAVNDDIFKKIGYKSIINRLLELGAFRGRDKTDIESVNNAPMTDAVKLISIENSQ